VKATPEDRPCLYHFQGELSCGFHFVDAHAALGEDEELAVWLLGGVEGFSCSKMDLLISLEEVPKEFPNLLFRERLQDVHLGE